MAEIAVAGELRQISKDRFMEKETDLGHNTFNLLSRSGFSKGPTQAPSGALVHQGLDWARIKETMDKGTHIKGIGKSTWKKVKRYLAEHPEKLV
ncbi:MAG: hypothetical protein M1484_01590 [Patescibacteria group bacterium]|nr:hypothetical protein [Patescibacteria group bacterium]MCL5431773.1 hypothetical protein [Patescibacteria group bacterium]